MPAPVSVTALPDPPVPQIEIAGSAPDADLRVIDRANAASVPLVDAGQEWPGDPAKLPDRATSDGLRTLAAITPTTRGEARAVGVAIGAASTDCREVSVALALPPGLVDALVEGLVLGGYRPARWTASGAVAGSTPATRVVLQFAGDQDADRAAAQAAVTRGSTLARASLRARDLANTPSNIKSPQWMVDRAAEVAKTHRLEFEVLEDDQLRERGFGGLVAVGGGSVSPPRFVRMGYHPTEATTHVVLVGKGITFDTGGLDLKPADAMGAMRTDMSGSAVVLATIAAAAELGLPVRITALLALAENALGEASYRPSDVVTPYGGARTVEITNTDAEGRMVLADALAYADRHLDPDVLLDVATLTGAARVAFARSGGVVFTPADELADALASAGSQAGETFWRLPLVEDYREFLRSDIADLQNAPGKAGAITAALFLEEFVGSRRWAHLDIAGPGRSDDDTGLLTKGATGYGARTLLTWLGDLT